jgi:SAM-dependent methyltransferase
MTDRSNGWETVAAQLIAARERRQIGATAIAQWAATLPESARLVDLGCGSGVPVTEVLLVQGCHVSGIDPAPTLIEAYARRFPTCRAACETAEDTLFFGERFDAIVAIGLLFLLPAEVQRTIIARVARALRQGGHFLFTAPAVAHPPWKDSLTGRYSLSLGKAGYVNALANAGLTLIHEFDDEGDNHYYDALRIDSLAERCQPES